MNGSEIQIEDGGFTRIHNTILVRLAQTELTGREWRVLAALLRLTYGFNKKEDAISLSQFCEVTRMAKGHISVTLKKLAERRIINRTETGAGRGHITIYGFNKYYNQWDSEERLPLKVTDGGNNYGEERLPQTAHKGYPKRHKKVTPDHEHTKDSITKDIKTSERVSNDVAYSTTSRPPAKQVHHNSPHLDARRFANGYIPAGTATNPVEVYYERFDIREDGARLNAMQEDDLARLCPDLAKLRDAITAYSRTNYRRGNVQLILDWYTNGPSGKPSSNGNGSDPHADALATRAKIERDAQRTIEKYGQRPDPMRGTVHAAGGGSTNGH